MANEIIVLETTRGKIQLMFLYPITSPKVVKGKTIVPTPATDAEGLITYPALAELSLTTQEKMNLDNGTLAFEIPQTFTRRPGITNAQVISRAKQVYLNYKAEFDADYVIRYQFTGSRISI